MSKFNLSIIIVQAVIMSSVFRAHEFDWVSVFFLTLWVCYGTQLLIIGFALTFGKRNTNRKSKGGLGWWDY